MWLDRACQCWICPQPPTCPDLLSALSLRQKDAQAPSVSSVFHSTVSSSKEGGQKKRFRREGKACARLKIIRHWATGFPKSNFHDCNTLTFSNKGSVVNTYTPHTHEYKDAGILLGHICVWIQGHSLTCHVCMDLGEITLKKKTTAVHKEQPFNPPQPWKRPEQTERARRSPRGRAEAGRGTIREKYGISTETGFLLPP